MPTIQTRFEEARGCGRRVKGGMYLVSYGSPKPCGLLPAEVPQNIIVSRGYQWVTARLVQYELDDYLFTSETRRGCASGACSCWLNALDPETPCLLDWVGMAYYKDTTHFMNEWKRMGISRRVGQLPAGFKVGETPLFLAHREASKVIDPRTGEPTVIRQIFAAVVPQAIEYVVRGDESEEYLESLEAKGITLVDVRPVGESLDLDLNFDFNE